MAREDKYKELYLTLDDRITLTLSFNFQTANKMMSQFSILAGRWDRNNPALYYCIASLFGYEQVLFIFDNVIK